MRLPPEPTRGYRNVHTPQHEYHPLLLSILGANFGLFFVLRGLHWRKDAGLSTRQEEGPSNRKKCDAARQHLLPARHRAQNTRYLKPCDAPSSHPARLPNSSMAAQNRSHGFHVVSNRSPSRIRSVRLISLGMTTRPSSSILRTIPVARNVPILLDGGATLMPHCFAVCLCIPSMEFGGVIMRRKDLGHVSPDGILEKNSARLKPGMAPEKRFH